MLREGGEGRGEGEGEGCVYDSDMEEHGYGVFFYQLCGFCGFVNGVNLILRDGGGKRVTGR